MKKFETLVGSDAAGTLKDLPLDEAGRGQEGAAASNGAVVRSDLPRFKTDDRGVELLAVYQQNVGSFNFEISPNVSYGKEKYIVHADLNYFISEKYPEFSKKNL